MSGLGESGLSEESPNPRVCTLFKGPYVLSLVPLVGQKLLYTIPNPKLSERRKKVSLGLLQEEDLEDLTTKELEDPTLLL